MQEQNSELSDDGSICESSQIYDSNDEELVKNFYRNTGTKDDKKRQNLKQLAGNCKTKTSQRDIIITAQRFKKNINFDGIPSESH